MTLNKMLIGVLAAWCALVSCSQDRQQESFPDAFYDEGQMWAFGAIKLGPMRYPGAILAEGGPGSQADDEEQSDQDASFRFQSLRRHAEGGPEFMKVSDLVYADYHPEYPQRSLTLGYLYDLVFEARQGSDAVYDVYFILRHREGGHHFEGGRQIRVGAVEHNVERDFASLNLSAELKVSEIVEGPLLGRWALHPAEVQPDQKDQSPLRCPDEAQSASTLGNQGPQLSDQGFICTIEPAIAQSCADNPTDDDCLLPGPSARSDTSSPFEQFGEIKAAQRLSEGVYISETSADESVEISFVSHHLEAADAQKAKELCQNQFYAVGRTYDDYVHPSCRIRLGPSSRSVDGRLSCQLLVDRDVVISYIEQPCNIVVAFVIEAGREEEQVLQLIQR